MRCLDAFELTGITFESPRQAVCNDSRARLAASRAAKGLHRETPSRKSATSRNGPMRVTGQANGPILVLGRGITEEFSSVDAAVCRNRLAFSDIACQEFSGD